MTQALSVTLICKNAEATIERAIRSVAFADEVIVLDSGSTDNTVKLCQALGATVIETDWPGFGLQKNRAISYTTHDWVLSLDADEWVSDELQTAIKGLLSQKTLPYTAYSIKRLSSFMGKWIKHGDWTNDYVLRLFDKHQCEFSEDKVHEKLLVKGRVGKLTPLIYHEAYTSLEQVITKMNQYSTLGASMRYERGKRGSWLQALVKSTWCFVRGYIFRLGFLDGREGFILSSTNAQGVYFRSLKMAYLVGRKDAS